MSEWAYTESAQCYCGGAAVVLLLHGRPRLFCFTHTKGEGAYFPLPVERPEWWPKNGSPPEDRLETLMLSMTESEGDAS